MSEPILVNFSDYPHKGFGKLLNRHQLALHLPQRPKIALHPPNPSLNLLPLRIFPPNPNHPPYLPFPILPNQSNQHFNCILLINRVSLYLIKARVFLGESVFEQD
jgi:hypothetical protein